ncbi:MAG: ATP-binding protein [bacterium]
MDEPDLSLRQEFIDWLWRLGRPVQITGGSAPSALPDSIHEVEAQLVRIEARICVPLNITSRLVGLLVLGKKNSGVYSEEDFEILETLSNQAALAIHNFKLRRHLQDARELESFYKFTSFVIHDLRNVVSVLSMLSENARENMDRVEFRNSLTTTLEDSVDRMKQMLSRVSLVSNQVEISLEKVNLTDFIEKSVSEIRIKEGVDLQLRFETTCDLTVDPTQLEKVILNLLINAVEAMPGGGAVMVRTEDGSREELPPGIKAEWSPDEFVKISVSDTGVGMSPEFIRTRLFRPFQTTKNKGLGIGLYHCKEIVEAHGGRIWVNSLINAGTTFNVGFPVRLSETALEPISTLPAER